MECLKKGQPRSTIREQVGTASRWDNILKRYLHIELTLIAIRYRYSLFDNPLQESMQVAQSFSPTKGVSTGNKIKVAMHT